MRIIAGQYRSRPLKSLPGLDIRPTSDRLRETLFNVLTAGAPAALEGCTFLDLYAGTGAVGIEALSRGAGHVYFVEFSRKAAGVVLSNLRSLGIGSGFNVLQQDVSTALRQFEESGIHADVIFLDPPYRLDREYRRTLEMLAASPLLKPDTIVIAEHEKKFDPGDGFGPLCRYRTLRQGDAALSFYRFSPSNT